MRLVSITLILSLLFACGQSEQKDTVKELEASDFHIIGYFDTIPDGTKIVLTYLGIDTISDTAVVKDGQFKFSGRMPEPLMAQLYLLDANNNAGAALSLIAENATINIEGKKGPLQTATVIGGINNTEYNTLKKIVQLYWDSISVLKNKRQEAERLKDSVQIKSLALQLDTMEVETRKAIKQFVVEHPKSIAGAFYISEDIGHYNLTELDSIYQSFDTSLHSSIYVKKIKERLDVSRRTAIGQQAPELNINNAELDTVKLSLYRGKFLLIDFWASWCSPCRKQNAELVKIYKRYKAKGFDILSVSLDEEKNLWLQAVRKDNLSWKHVSDLKGWNSSVVALYGIDAIPANVLIDRGGKIVAKNIEPARLSSTLDDVLQ
jgi:peroxiredoxin